MDTTIWGPLMWQFINDVAIVNDEIYHRLEEHERHLIPKFVKHLKYMLPCKWCRQSYSVYISELPPQTPMKEWVYKVHEKVNRKLKRKSVIGVDKFLRRCEVYGGFGSTEHLWDLLFILALNYEPQKRDAYKLWFEYMGFIYAMLVKYRGYEDREEVRYLWKNFSLNVLDDKDSLLRYLSAHRPIGNKIQDVTYWVQRYRYAFAYNDPEEMLRLCGPYR